MIFWQIDKNISSNEYIKYVEEDASSIWLSSSV